MANTRTAADKLNFAIEELLKSSKSTEIISVLRHHLRLRFYQTKLKWFLILVCAISTIYFVPFFNWHATAIGRLFLIKIVLPVYDWRPLARAYCLVDRIEFSSPAKSTDLSFSNDISNRENCVFCENLSQIERVPSISFEKLQSKFLRRHRPVIVSNSHREWSTMHESVDFMDFLASNNDLKSSRPCNFKSNFLRKAKSVSQIFQRIDELDDDWFTHFCNCDFDAVKASRSIIPIEYRPQYLSNHLPPFQSSWILMSHNYTMKKSKRIDARNLVVALQLAGEISGYLQVEEYCQSDCNDHDFTLKPGEAIVFSAELWNFFYRTNSNENIFTFILEIERKID